MRSDMAKVVCEEPRHGMRTKSPKGSHRENGRVPMDEKPVKEKGNLRRNWLVNYYSHKQFGEHVQPLRRFMLSCIGRKWDDVYSEIRRTIPKGTVVNDHIYSHLFQYVATNVYMIDGMPYDGDYSSWRCRKGLPVYQDTYVHPDTGIICKTPPPVTKYQRKKKRRDDFVSISTDNATAYYRKDGIWYVCKFSEFPEYDSTGYDIMYREQWSIRTYIVDLMRNKVKRNNRNEVMRHFIGYYGKPIYCYQKSQIGKKEIKKLNARLHSRNS